MDPNPYQSPQAEKPRAQSRPARRSIGLAVILLLTPPAMVIAVLTCCSAERNLDAFPHLQVLFSRTIIYGGPFLVLIAMLVLAWYIHARQPIDPDPAPFRRVLIATPFLLAAAIFAGFFLAAIAYFVVSKPGGDQVPGGEWVILGAFFLPPSLTLLSMLRLAWRYR